MYNYNFINKKMENKENQTKMDVERNVLLSDINDFNRILDNDMITSFEILAQINFFRKQENNKSELRHSELLRTIRDEFEE